MDPATAALAAAGIQAGGSLLGGMFGASGQAATNAQQIAANQQMQQSAQQFSDIQAGVQRDWAAGQAESQRDYESFMSDTAYQRQMQDMRLAGLNPILAAGSMGGASTPSVGIPSGSTAAGVAGNVGSLGNPGESIQRGITSAAGAANTYANMRTALAQASKDDSATELNKKTTEVQDALKGFHLAATDKAKADTVVSAKQLDKLDSDILANRAAASSSTADAAYKAAQTIIAGHEASSAEQRARIAKREADDAVAYGSGQWGQAAGAGFRTTATVAKTIYDTVKNTLGAVVDQHRTGINPVPSGNTSFTIKPGGGYVKNP